MLVLEPWRARGGSRSAHYASIRAGLMTPGVRAPNGCAGWPAAELAAIDAAVARGAPPDAIRDLVRKLIEQRGCAAGVAAEPLAAPIDYSAAGARNQCAVERELLTESEAQELLGVGGSKYRELTQREDFPQAVQFGPRTRRRVRSELIRWSLAQRAGAVGAEVA